MISNQSTVMAPWWTTFDVVSKMCGPWKGSPGARRDFGCCSSDNVSSFSRGWAQPREQLCTQEQTPPPTPPPQPRNLSSVHEACSRPWTASLEPGLEPPFCHWGGYIFFIVHYLCQVLTQLKGTNIPILKLSLSLFSHSVMSHTSPSPGVCSNFCPLNWWCYPTVSSSATPFSTCLQSFPALGSFPMSQLFTLGGQSIATSASGPSSE